jgi:hypothetical protein
MRRLLWTAAVIGIALTTAGMCRASDQEVAEEIKYNLKEVLRNYSVGIKVQDRTAWLDGSVADERQMAAALAIARQTPGVERVVNNMAIGSSQSFGGRSTSSLRQPSNIAASIRGGVQPAVDNYQPYGYPAPYQGRGVVQATMELPDHAQQELRMGGPMADMGDDSGAAYGGNRSTYGGRAVPQPRGFAGRADGYQNYPQGGPMNPQGNMGWGPADQAYGGYGQGNAGYGPNEMNSAPGNFAPAPLNVAAQRAPNMMRAPRQQAPLPLASADSATYHQVSAHGESEMIGAPQPLPAASPLGPGQPAPYHYDSPHMPGYAWPSYAAYPNYASVTYPKQYSPTAWPYIGPFYPYPQVPLGWRKVSLEWKDGWWFLDFKDNH